MKSVNYAFMAYMMKYHRGCNAGNKGNSSCGNKSGYCAAQRFRCFKIYQELNAKNGYGW